MEKSTKQLKKVFEKSNSEIENEYDILPVEIDSDNSKDVIRSKKRALSNIAQPGVLLRETLGSLLMSCNSLGLEQDDSGRANDLGVPIQILCGDKKKRRDNISDLPEKIHKAVSSTEYTGKTMESNPVF